MAISLQSFDAATQEDSSWGWIRWLISDRLCPGAEQTVGVVHINVGQRNPTHVHPNCEELLYVTNGQCEHFLGQDSVKMKAGDLIRVPAGIPHYAKTIGDQPMEALIMFSAGDRQTSPAQ